MDKKIGFIGCGNMGSAMIAGMLRSGVVTAERIAASCKSESTAERMAGQYRIRMRTDNRDIARESDILFLAVKPNVMDAVISEIRDVVTEDKLVVSVAAGKSIAAIEASFDRQLRLIRMMPNTPALAGEAMSALSANAYATQEDLETVMMLCESFGKAEAVPETLMDAVVGVSGSSPAYAYLFMEAMADAAVADGMPRGQAYRFAAQSLLGAARMVLDTGRHPAELKDAVCSPGGTTIEAVATLEKEGFRNAVIAAQRACVRKSMELGKDA